MQQGRVLSNTAFTARLYALRIEVQLAAFEAGQFVRLQLSIDDEAVAKPYSLVNPPADPVAEVFFNTVPGGLLSNALAGLQAGDPIAVSQPATGFFTLSGTPAARDLWLFATGTGLGPYLSILRTPQLWQRYKNVALVHGVPLREELVYSDIITAVQNEHADNFHYLPCVSREAGPDGMQGRVTDLFEAGELERRSGLFITPADSAVMLCGNHNMIVDMQSLLARRDMRKHLRHKPGHIITEQYF
jgi:ferredoxin--NADP+ reductase